MRPYEHAITTGFVRGFHNEVMQVFDHVLTLVIIPTNIGGNIGENYIFSQVVFNDLWNIRINDLVVSNAGPRRVCEGDTSGAVDVHQAGNAKHRVGTEGRRIEKVVIDPAIDHIDAFESFRGSHHDIAVHDDKITSLDKFDSH